MNFRFTPVVIAMGFVAILGGCVSSGTYQQKEQESQLLSKNLDESRSSYAELQQKHNKVVAESEAELKKQKAELAEAGANNEQLAGQVNKLTLELAEAKVEKDKLGRANADLIEKQEKLAVNFVDARAENDKQNLANLRLTEQVQRLAAEIAELKLANEKLAAAVKPENLLKTVGENFELLQLKIDRLSGENANLKQTLLEMRRVTKLPPAEPLSKGGEAKPAAP